MANGDALDVNDITTHLSIDLLGIVLDDENVISSSNKGEPVVMDPQIRQRSAIAILHVVFWGIRSAYVLDIGKAGFFGKIKSIFAK